MFCCSLKCVHSNFAITSMEKRKLVAFLCLSSWCLAVPRDVLGLSAFCDRGIS